MRTYLQARVIRPFGKDTLDLVLVCGCGQEKRLADWYEHPMRPAALDSLNTNIAAARMAEFNYQHSSCPDETPPPSSDGGNFKP